MFIYSILPNTVNIARNSYNLLFIEDDEVLAKPGVVRTIYDPTAGTGGMLSVAGEYLEEHNPQARLTMFGQDTRFAKRIC